MLCLLGTPRVNEEPAAGLPRKAFVAVAMLDFADSARLSRETLAAALWPDATSRAARLNLRQLIARTKAWESATGSNLWLSAPAQISRGRQHAPSDIQVLLSAQVPSTPAELLSLSQLFSGELLEGDEEPPELSQWIRERRAELRERFLSLILRGAVRVGGAAAATALERLGRIAPYDDAVARALISSLVSLGEHERAARAYDAFAARLQADLHTPPEPATVQLYRELGRAAAQPRNADIGVKTSLLGVPRVLILPPLEPGLDARGAILGGSLIDEITHTLSRARTFAVFAPHSARQLAVTAFPSANPYGADYLVTTRLLPRGPRELRLTLALIKLDSHEMLLSEEMSFAHDALGAHHFSIAAALARRLTGRIEQAEFSIYRSTGAASAYVQYLLGNEKMRNMDLPSLRSARRHYRQAVKLSPTLTPAKAMLARALCLEWVLLDRRDNDQVEAALALATAAAEDDPLDPAAHREIGHALIYLDRLDEAVDRLQSAVGLGPHYADILYNYADGLIHVSRVKDARKAMDDALALNPLPPDIYHWASATIDYFLEEYGNASASLARMQNPQSAARVVAAVEAKKGDLARAAHFRDLFMASHPEFRIADYHVPMRRPEDREHYLDGLRLAGFH